MARHEGEGAGMLNDAGETPATETTQSAWTCQASHQPLVLVYF